LTSKADNFLAIFAAFKENREISNSQVVEFLAPIPMKRKGFKNLKKLHLNWVSEVSVTICCSK
jgi:hypothetical protein